MTDGADVPAFDQVAAQPDNQLSAKPDINQPTEPDRPPTLSAYFADNTASLGSFVKAVRKSGLTRFEESDLQAALDAMREHDRHGEKLWKLLSQKQMAGMLSTWTRRAIQSYFATVFGPEVDLTGCTAEQFVEILRQRFPAHVVNRDDSEARSRMFCTRIAAIWLVNRQHVPPWELLQSFGSLSFSSEKEADRPALSAVRLGSLKEFELSLAIGFLGRSAIDTRERAIKAAHAESENLRQRLGDKVAENSQLLANVQTLESENAQLSASLRSLRDQIAIERQHAGYDITELKGQHSVLLRERLKPLIRDAIDALEIDSPARDIALSRLMRAESTIEEFLS